MAYNRSCERNNSEGSNCEDSNCEGRNPDGNNYEGSNSEGRNSEGRNCEGRNSVDSNCEGRYSGGRNFEEEICRFIGETVTIFTTSGGESGDGFTGVVLSVNSCFVRLITQIGTAPACPLGNSCNNNHRCGNNNNIGRFRVGSVTDIATNRIAAFVQNAV